MKFIFIGDSLRQENDSSTYPQDQDDEISYGLTLRNELYEVRRKDKRTKLPLSRLTLGVKCGGSDGFSELTANPLLGRVSDIIGASCGKEVKAERSDTDPIALFKTGVTL